MNMSKEFWDEVERIKPPVRERMSGSMAPVLTGVVFVDEELGVVKVEVMWIFPPDMCSAFNHLRVREQMPVVRINVPSPGESK